LKGKQNIFGFLQNFILQKVMQDMYVCSIQIQDMFAVFYLLPIQEEGRIGTGWKEGGREGRKKEGRKEGREGGREGGSKEGKKGGREEGRKGEGREEGRKEKKSNVLVSVS
jgi:hypothetical protein